MQLIKQMPIDRQHLIGTVIPEQIVKGVQHLDDILAVSPIGAGSLFAGMEIFKGQVA